MLKIYRKTNMYAIEFNQVWKKFKKGEKIYSLRDAIPRFTRNILLGKASGNSEKLHQEEFWAVHNVSFQVKRGEVLGIIGPNGAGKSTILKLLSRIMKPTKGEFKINGRLSALIEVTAGFHPDFTGRENIYFNGAVLGMTKKEIDSKFEDIVDFSGIREFIDTPVKRYSSGMSARLGFSVAAHVNPDVLLVDEVLAVGDMTFQSKCTQKMRELLKSGVTIIFISHNVPLVQSLCDRLILLDHGTIIKEGLPDEVVPHYENSVSKRREEELKQILENHSENETVVDIEDVSMINRIGEERDHFNTYESLTLRLRYHAYTKVEKPVFTFEIVRADNVVCCSGDSKEGGLFFDKIEEKGEVLIHLDDLHLSPGVYFVRAAISDEKKEQYYKLAKRCVFRIASEKPIFNSSIVLVNPKWEKR